MKLDKVIRAKNGQPFSLRPEFSTFNRSPLRAPLPPSPSRRLSIIPDATPPSSIVSPPPLLCLSLRSPSFFVSSFSTLSSCNPRHSPPSLLAGNSTLLIFSFPASSSISHNFVSSFDSLASDSHTFSQASLSFTSTRGPTSFLHRRLFPFWLFACFLCFVFLSKGHIWEAETEKQFDLDGVVILPIQDILSTAAKLEHSDSQLITHKDSNFVLSVKSFSMKEIEALWNEVRDLSLGNSTRVERLESPPNPLEFLRGFVSPNKPCIISNAINHWPALCSWTNHSYLTHILSSSSVSLHLTPNGHADALVPLDAHELQGASPPSASSFSPETTASSSSFCFASAHVECMPFPEALSLISSGGGDCSSNLRFVAYAQQQNDCFRSEYSALADDCDPHIPWATDALGCVPEAVNLWIGNQHSHTSFHKDHYENLYAVVTGEKHFLLLPPSDVHRMYIREYPASHYRYSWDTGEFTLELEKPTRYVPWCSVNPYPSAETKDDEMSKFPLYFNDPEPLQCTVKAGEILYLPSMWFHHVRQSPDERGCTIAVNYWYDMQFDIKYAYFNFLQSLHCRSALKSTSSEDLHEDSDNA